MKNNYLCVFVLLPFLSFAQTQKLTLDLQDDFRYISAPPGVTLYMVSSNRNQLVVSGKAIYTVTTEVDKEVLSFQIETSNGPYFGPVVLFYDEKDHRLEPIFTNYEHLSVPKKGRL
ncbi:MAG: hypothetical protein AAGL34_02160 [Bacteroidota bacterium]